MITLFSRYFSVGILNTLIHWSIFSLCYMLDQPQSISNFLAFLVAVTFSFVVNAKWTFKSKATLTRYALYLGFMGVLSLLVGYAADRVALNPIITLCSFSIISLLCGFVYSNFIVFRGKK